MYGLEKHGVLIISPHKSERILFNISSVSRNQKSADFTDVVQNVEPPDGVKSCFHSSWILPLSWDPDQV